MNEMPYPGLRPFEREESFLFFGREEHTDQVLEKLAHIRFISVVGLSGCGKSSLVRAGVIAALETGYMATAGPDWRIALMRPGSAPLDNLAAALCDVPCSHVPCSHVPCSHVPCSRGIDKSNESPPSFPSQTDTSPDNIAQTAEFLASHGPLGLVDLLCEKPLPEHTNLLIVVDQFEEIFRYHRQGDRYDAANFVALLLTSAEQHEIPIYVVSTMRSDFIGDCALFRGLPEVMNAGQFLVPRLTREQQRMAMLGPAKVFGGDLEPRLVARLLDEMGNDPDQLPLLQHCLMRMWLRAMDRVQGDASPSADLWDDASGVVMTLADYDAIGGLKQALSDHADEAFSELTEQGRRIAESLFRRLSERGADQRDIRRPTPVSELAEVAGVAPAEIKAVVEAFRRPDRCFLTPPADNALTPETFIDIGHESLIRQWQRMTAWVREEAESAEIYQRLEKTALRWQQGLAALWTPPDLDIALQWRRQEQPTDAWAARYGNAFDLAMQFLDASQQAEQERHRQERHRRAQEEQQRLQQERQKIALQQERWRRKFFTGMGIVLAFGLVVMFGLFFNARTQSRLAQEQRAKAEAAKEESERQTRIARSAELSAQAQVARFEGYPQRSLLLALEALRVSQEANEPRSSFAEEVLRETLSAAGGQAIKTFDADSGGMTLSPDGRSLAMLRNGNVRYWRKLSDAEPEMFGENIKTLAFSPDGNWIVTGSFQDIVIWNLETNPPWRYVAFPRGHEGAVADIVVSSDWRWAATRDELDAMFLWEVNMHDSGLAPRIVYHDTSQTVKAVALSPDNRWFALGRENGDVDLYVLSSEGIGEPFQTLRQHQDQIQKMAFSPDGEWLAACDFDGTAYLWRIAAVAPTAIPVTPADTAVTALAFDPENRWLLTGSDDHSIRLWDLQAATPGLSAISLAGHEGAVTDLRLSPDGRWLLSASEDQTIRSWNLRAGARGTSPRNLSFALHVRTQEMSSVAIRRDENDRCLAAFGYKDGTACLRVGDPECEPVCFPAHEDSEVSALAFSADARHLLSASSEDGRVLLWDLTSDIPAPQLLAEDLFMAASGPEGRCIAGIDADNVVWLWDADADDPVNALRLMDAEDLIFPVAFSPETRKLIAADADYANWILWNLETQPGTSTILGKLEEGFTPAISPDGSRIVLGTSDGTVKVWDAADLSTPHRILPGPEEAVRKAAISAENQWVAAGGEDGRVWLWRLNRPGQAPVELGRHAEGVSGMMFSADQRWLLTGSEDGAALLWTLRPQELHALACQTAGRNLTAEEWEHYFRDAPYRNTCPE